MNYLISLFLILSGHFQTDLTSIRTNFERSADSKDNTALFYNSLKNYSGNDNIMIGYKGAALALQSRFVVNKKDKKDMFVNGAKDIERAITKGPNDVELRLIRLIIQENTPKILKYKSNISEDKQMILANYDKQSKSLKEEIKRYALNQSKLFSDTELRKFN